MATTGASVLFDPSDPAVRRDPYPTYRRMLEEAPIWQSPDGIFYLSRYQDCADTMRHRSISYNPDNLSNFEQRLSDDPAKRAALLAESRRQRAILDVDPPDHTRLRSLISRAFTITMAEATRPNIARIVDDLLDHFDGPSVELVSRFGVLVPVLVICDMLGVPADERDIFIELGFAVAASVDPDVPIDVYIAAHRRKRDYIADLIERRRRNPGDDLITRLIAAADDGRLASADELVMNTSVLLGAGFETTTNLITTAVYQLLTHPDQLEALQADGRLIGAAVEEALRFDPPVQLIRPHSFTSIAEIGGHTFQPGDPITVVVAAANRDPAEFPDPERFDITRSPNRHLTFGMGIHLCVGASLARLEAQIAVARLFERFPNLSLADEPTLRPTISLRGFEELRVTW